MEKERIRQKWMNLSLLPLSAILTFLSVLLGAVPLLIAGALVLAWVVITFFNWRCPICRKILPLVDDDGHRCNQSQRKEEKCCE